ncbi:MAG: hypothetical protein MJZ93_04890, partial [Paludibacteraceae bacterium]|nr:hypothetical protein [Paludibacteraceae bacterium]
MFVTTSKKKFILLMFCFIVGFLPTIFAQTSQIEGSGMSGLFSIGANKTVVFSQGNLQCRKNSNGTYDWKFADHQYDRLKEQNENIGNTGVWFDLFGYGTSNYTYGRTTFVPSQSSTSSGQSAIHDFWDFIVAIVRWGLGFSADYPGTDLHYPDLRGGYSEYNMDWGLNAIEANGRMLQAGTWATLTQAEWNYLLNQRANASSLRGMYVITIGTENIEGLLLLPDGRTDLNFSMPWSDLEAEGAVFLPCAGIRQAKVYKNYYNHNYNPNRDNYFKGYYWSSTCSNTVAQYLGADFDAPYAVHFDENSSVVLDHQFVTFYGMSVRLAREVNIPVIFNYGDGSKNDTIYVNYGDLLPAAPRTPVGYHNRECYFKRFNGWDLVAGTRIFQRVTVNAQYDEEFASYKVIYRNWDGAKLDSVSVSCENKGSYYRPDYQPRTTPPCGCDAIKDADDCYTYTFDGWNVAPTVTKDTVYYATFTPHKRTDYTVTFKNWDGTTHIIYNSMACDSVPIEPTIPTKAQDCDSTYSFDGWLPNTFDEAKNCSVYTATFIGTAREYTITFVDSLGSTPLKYKCG